MKMEQNFVMVVSLLQWWTRVSYSTHPTKLERVLRGTRGHQRNGVRLSNVAKG